MVQVTKDEDAEVDGGTVVVARAPELPRAPRQQRVIHFVAPNALFSLGANRLSQQELMLIYGTMGYTVGTECTNAAWLSVVSTVAVPARSWYFLDCLALLQE